MATKIVTKNSSTASAVPTASDLVQGELAVNVADKRLFTEDNAGAIVELGTNPSTLTVTGEITANGGIALGDNDKATFGVGDDLQIYHEPNNSIIKASVGSLLIQGDNIRLQKVDGTENMLTAVNDGQLKLFYDGAEKLATTSTGIDVTGTATMDGLSISNASGGNVAQFTNVSSADLNINLTSGVTLLTPSTGILAFGTVTTERMRIDSSGNVGIGNSAPLGKLTISNAAGTNAPSTVTAANTYLQLGSDDYGPSNNGKFMIGFGFTDATNTNSPAYIGYEEASTSGDTYGDLTFYTRSVTTDTAPTERMRIDSSGNLTTRQSTGNNFRVIRNGDNSVEVGNYNATDGYQNTAYISSTHTFYAGTAGAGGASRAVDIDSSGNVIVGTTNLAPVSNNVQGVSIRSFGELQSSRDGAATLYLNRKTNDGDIVILRKDGADVGSIGTETGNLNINSASTGFLSTVGTRRLNWDADQLYPQVDNDYNLGHPSHRYDDIYATNGTIQTSDRNEKQDIAELSDAEQRVAVAAKGLLRKFRWKDSVAKKGDEARIHFGIIAQDLQAAFAAEGLDAGDYAMFISTTWTDEETNEEKTRMGVRYSELLAFIIAAI